MSGLQLFRVTVTETFVAEGEALVWALDRYDAELAAEKKVSLEAIDAESDGVETDARIEPIETVIGLTDRNAHGYWLIAPVEGRAGQWDTVDLKEFRALLDPERMEAARIAAIEHDNGQLALLTIG